LIVTATTSPSLLLRIRNAADAGAWQEFLEIYAPIVRDYCLQRRLQASDVDDIVQEVMTTVSTAIRKFDYDPTKGNFRSWLGTLAANRIRNHLAKQNNHKIQSFDNEDFLGAGLGHTGQLCTDPDSTWVEVFSERIFQAACQRIRPEVSDLHWSCFEATWVRNENAADVARSLNIPVHQIYVNKSRVLKRLEAEVKMLAEEVPFSIGKSNHAESHEHGGTSSK
jgi:RNA polymerase sigma-70 factor (ECF subfamily)